MAATLSSKRKRAVTNGRSDSFSANYRANIEFGYEKIHEEGQTIERAWVSIPVPCPRCIAPQRDTRPVPEQDESAVKNFYSAFWKGIECVSKVYEIIKHFLGLGATIGLLIYLITTFKGC